MARYGCGEFIPGTLVIGTPTSKPPVPRKIIPKHRRTGTGPPLVPGPDYDPIDPRSPNPGSPGIPTPGSPTPPPPPPGPGPTTPGPGSQTGPGGTTTPGPGGGPVTPGPGGPGPGGGGGPISSPTGPATPGPSGPTPPRFSPIGPSTPGPGGPGTGGGGGQEEEEEPPRRRFEEPPNLTFAISPTVRLDDEPNGGGGGPITTFASSPTSRLEDVDNNTNPGVVGSPTLSLQDSQGGGGGSGGILQSNSNQNNFSDPKKIITYNFPSLKFNNENSNFSNSISNNNNLIYDPIYNIMDHSTSPITLVSNNLYRNIFKSRVAREVKYLLLSHDERNWNERDITGLTLEKISRSLDSLLLEAFNKILNIDGTPVDSSYFLLGIRKHLLNGTINEFNPQYYITLADSVSKREKVVINQSQNQQTKINSVLALLESKSHAIDPRYYRSGTERYIEIARTRFLLSDIESTFDVETIDGTEYQLELHDAGVQVEYADPGGLELLVVQPSSDYVPPGEGDGYYYKIETASGNLLPLILDTQLSSAYYSDPDTRRLALTILGEDPSFRFSASLPYDSSEFGSSYQQNYTAETLYFKLDLRTIINEPTKNKMVESIFTDYILLTDEDAIKDHGKTYGSKVIQLTLQYDDPFFQYAKTAEKMSLNMRDITFRQFPKKRTPSGDAILTRNLPDGIIITPTNLPEDNPLFADSDVLSFGQTVTRELIADISFDLVPDDLFNKALNRVLTWDEEKKFEYGLIGLSDINNFYYLFNRGVFNQSYSVSSRSPEGDMLFRIINRLESKYDFRYLTWWDVYRRLTLSEFRKLNVNFPSALVDAINRNFLGYQIKDVLYGDPPSNLTEVNSAIDDPIYLDELSRGNTIRS